MVGVDVRFPMTCNAKNFFETNPMGFNLINQTVIIGKLAMNFFEKNHMEFNLTNPTIIIRKLANDLDSLKFLWKSFD